MIYMGKPIFSEEMNWEGHKFKLDFFDETDFSNLKNVTQVYGFVFNDKDELLIVKCGDDNWSLPGGGPEDYDSGWEETLVREVNEEADVELKDIVPAFYVRSTDLESGEEVFQLRFVARVKKISEQTIDPASGIINERKFVSTEEFVKYVGLGENGKIQLDTALKIFNK
jgi:ADP-ribose pyrophosphatase YjhB (NUDIX family)